MGAVEKCGCVRGCITGWWARCAGRGISILLADADDACMMAGWGGGGGRVCVCGGDWGLCEPPNYWRIRRMPV